MAARKSTANNTTAVNIPGLITEPFGGIATTTGPKGMTYVGYTKFISPKNQKEHKVLHFAEGEQRAQVVMPGNYTPWFQLIPGTKIVAYWEDSKLVLKPAE